MSLKNTETGHPEQGITTKPLLLEKGAAGELHTTVAQGHTAGNLTALIRGQPVLLRSPVDKTANPETSLIQVLTENRPGQVKYPSLLSDTTAMTVVLPDREGTVATIRRGQYPPLQDGHFAINGMRIPLPEQEVGRPQVTDLLEMFASPHHLGEIKDATIRLREVPPSDLMLIPASDNSHAVAVIKALLRLVPPATVPGGISDLWYIDEGAMKDLRGTLEDDTNERLRIDVTDPDALATTRDVEKYHPDINAKALIVALVERLQLDTKDIGYYPDIRVVLDMLGIRNQYGLIADADQDALMDYLIPTMRQVSVIAIRNAQQGHETSRTI